METENNKETTKRRGDGSGSNALVMPRCNCKGNPARGFMCGRVTVGGEYCTADYECEHKEQV